MHSALVVEDTHGLGELLSLQLQELGFQVLWVTKIEEVQDGGARVRCFPEPDSPIEEVRTIRWSDFAVALVDGVLGENWLEENGPHGWHIVPGIVAAQVPCIAMSTAPASNGKMTEQGARFATERKQRQDFPLLIVDFLQQLGLVPLF